MHAFADLIGLKFTAVADGKSTCEVPAVERLHNTQGVLHGAIAYAAADTGMGAALYSVMAPGERCATIEIKINYLGAVRTGKIVCHTRVLKKGRRVATLESDIFEGDTLVAKALGSYFVIAPKGDVSPESIRNPLDGILDAGEE